MKVLCKLDNFLDLDDKLMIERIKKYINLSDGQLNVEKNIEYNVYSIEFRDNAPWYGICLDYEDDTNYFPADLFEVTDKRMSKYWQLSFNNYISYDNSLEMQSSLVFPEWADDSTFFERFVDGDATAITIFKKYRKLMDLEFADSATTTTTMEFAKHIEDCWFMCDTCIYAWEDRNFLAMTRCPKCKSIYLNPIASNS